MGRSVKTNLAAFWIATAAIGGSLDTDKIASAAPAVEKALADPAATHLAKPTSGQIEWANRELEMFVHFGLTRVVSGVDTPKITPDQTHVTDDTLDLGAMMQPLPDRGIFREKDYFAWCSSIIQDGGKYHLIYSRWPRKFGFHSWLTHSEIAHAVADQPDGPYHYVETLIPHRGQHPWNQITAHNPKIERFEGKFYLYFCSTRADFSEDELQAIARNSRSRQKDWGILRNNQRTGVAVADSISGPWNVLSSPIVQPTGPIRNLTVNPAICRRPDGRYLMIIKGDKPGSSQRNQAVAIADKPEGPFVLQPEPAIKDYDTEDVSVWYDYARQRYYAVFHAHTFIGMITSADGIHWQKASHFTVTRKILPQQNGAPRQPSSLERPFVFVEKGRPRVLSMAAMETGDTCILLVPLQQPAASVPTPDGRQRQES